MSEVVSILCSDLHLSEKPPIARSEEPDWFGTMAGYLGELGDLSEEYNVPIVCGGDVFDKWKASPKLINFALNHLPFMRTVAGQHDLPNHRIDDLMMSAFQTLCIAGKMKYLPDCLPTYLSGWGIFGFSWGEKIESGRVHPDSKIKMLVTHKYVWYGRSNYAGALNRDHVDNNCGMFRGFDVVLLGDNHKPWMRCVGDCLVYNPGSFMRRHSDEVEHRPQVGLLKDDCTIDVHYLDISKDKFRVVERGKRQNETEFNMDEFMDGLKGLGEAGMDFVGAVKAFMDRESVKSSVRSIILNSMGEK